MSSLPFHLEPIVTTHYVVMGDVTIGEGSAIAPGVLLQADPGCRIMIGTGVCLGMGCVIHASGGAIQIGQGVNLGAGVLVVGASTIGDRALVGAGTTVFGQSIGPGELIAPSSLLMDAPLGAVANGKTDATATINNVTDPVNTDRVNVESHGYFYAKSNGKGPAPDAIADPWASEPVAVTSPPIVPHTGTPVVSTYVYPDDTLLPKHPWETTANTDLGSPVNPPIAQPTADQSPPHRSNPQSLHAPQPNPDSDLSAAEMQHAEPDPNSSRSGELAPRQPRPVYGQTYVNQVLGRMLGKP